MNIPRFVVSIILGSSLCLVGYESASALDLAECSALVPGDPDYGVVVTEGIVYGYGEVQSPLPAMIPLYLDLYEPPGSFVADRRPAILMIHGGAFIGGSRRFLPLVCMAAELAMRGFVVASIDYRLFADDPVLSDRVHALQATSMPGRFERSMIAAVEDGLTALDWLNASADTNDTDLTQTGVLGSSAGASTAIHLAYTVGNFGIDAPDLRFVVDFFGNAIIPFGGPPVDAVSYLETGESPLFIVHGTDDLTVPISFSELLAARADEQSVPYEFHKIADADHGFDSINPHVDEVAPGLTIFDRMVDWIHEVLPVQVDIDIRPGIGNNNINPRSRRNISVAILGSSDFDAQQVKVPTVRFGPGSAKAIRWLTRVRDVDDDGYPDLILRFRIRRTGIRCGDTEAELMGDTYLDESFAGTDSINTVGCN